jgi:peptide/nickel transport system substrate-binding protein
VRYDGHYSEPPAIEKYIFQTWPDDTAIIEALRADQLDAYLSNVPPGDVESFQTDENLGLAVYDTYDFTFYGYNLDATKTTLFQEQAVRQALIFAIDRESIVDNVYLGFAAVATGTQPVLSEAYAPDRLTTIYNYDPARASQLLDGAGWLVGGDGIREKDGVKMSFDFMFDAGSATSVSVAAAIQDYWKAIGVDGQPSAVDFDTVIVPAATETFDFRIMMLAIVGGSPSGDQSIIFGSEMRGAGLNLMGYSNPAYDELAAQANVEVDPEKRIELLIQATDIVNEDVPLAALWFPKDRIGYGKRLQNFTPTANGLLWSMPFVTVAQ